MVVMIEAGTTIPPIPSPARNKRPQSLSMLSGVAMDKAPHPTGCQYTQILSLLAGVN
jgi:hypothetical protein